jgi:hypothetical protein
LEEMGFDWESTRWRVDLFFSLFDCVLNPDYVYVTKLVGTVKRKIEPSGKKESYIYCKCKLDYWK